ncbi:MAG: tetratricopeptide repeat protein [Deltaproteobacteria bacterium]|nr:tetratricopeptide repeat protein [Deltaproteobacteria bacterium]
MTSCRRNIFAFVSLFLLILITYSNSFDASWHFDDVKNIVENKPLHLTELSLDNIGQTFFASWKSPGKLYRPVASFSFALNYYLHGVKVAGYHLVNLSIHFLAACFLFLFIYHTLNLPILQSKYNSNAYFVALLSTTLWAINPLQTQAVTYVVQRMTSLAGMFCIMAMYFYLKGRISSSKRIKMVYYTSCCIFGLLALGSKENAVMLPVVLLFYDLLLIRGLKNGSIKQYAIFLLIAILVCIAFALLAEGPSILSLKKLISSYQNRGFTLSERLLTEPRIILLYISLLLYPMPNRLCLEHNITLSTGLLTLVSTLAAVLSIALILCLAIAFAKKRPLISFCIIFFFINHLVESSILPLELIFEHRNYFPSMLFFVPMAILLSAGISFFSGKRTFQTLLTAFVVFVIIGWGHSTFIRNAVWKTDETLWSDCAGKYPELGRPHHNLGVYYAKNEMLQNAVFEYLMALNKENRNNLVASNWTYYNLGAIYQKLKRNKEALFYYDQAQKYQPHFAPTHIGKGSIFMKEGRYKEAVSAFEKAIDADPDNVSAYGNLGFLFLLTGKPEKAIANLKLASIKDPENAKIMRHLGMAYYLTGNTEKSFIFFRKALAHDKTDPFTLLNLAVLYQEKGMSEQKNDILIQFVAVFKGSTTLLKEFIDSLTAKPGTEHALNLYRKKLLNLLAEALMDKSNDYRRLADDCQNKKR